MKKYPKWTLALLAAGVISEDSLIESAPLLDGDTIAQAFVKGGAL